MREIVAVTFTEKAAAELRDRIRRHLESVAAGSVPERHRHGRATAAAPPAERRRWRSTSSTVRRCRRCTRSRSGCSSSTRSRPGSHRESRCSTTSSRSWRSTNAGPASSTALLDDPALERPLLLALNADMSRDDAAHPRARVQRELGPRRRTHAREPDPPPLAARPRCSPTLDGCRARSRRRAPIPTTSCSRGSSRSAIGSASWRARPTSTSSCGSSRAGAPKIGGNVGQEGELARSARQGEGAGRGACGCGSRSARDRGAIHASWGPSPGVGDRRSSPCARPTRRRRSGRLEFHDLLVLARAVLRDPEHGWEVRQRLRRALHPPAARRVPGHRPDPVRPRRAARVGRPRCRDAARGTSSPSIPAACSSSATRSSRSTASAAPTSRRSSRARSAFGAAPRHLTAQLPLDASGHRVRQPRVRAI